MSNSYRGKLSSSSGSETVLSLPGSERLESTLKASGSMSSSGLSTLGDCSRASSPSWRSSGTIARISSLRSFSDYSWTGSERVKYITSSCKGNTKLVSGERSISDDSISGSLSIFMQFSNVAVNTQVSFLRSYSGSSAKGSPFSSFL